MFKCHYHKHRSGLILPLVGSEMHLEFVWLYNPCQLDFPSE